MSERLYYNDSYLFEFEANVESVVKKDSYYEIILDKSAFYPDRADRISIPGHWITKKL